MIEVGKKEKIVIGGTLPALIYAYLNNIPFLAGKLEPPDPFDFFKWEFDLHLLNFEQTSLLNLPYGLFYGEDGVSSENYTEGTRATGVYKHRVWSRLYYVLTLAGLNLMGDKVESLSISDDCVKATTRRKVVRFKAKEYIIFSETNLRGLPPPEGLDVRCRVLDWFDVHGAKIHKYQFMYLPNELCKDVEFFQSGRAQKCRDLVGISVLNEHQLTQDGYTESDARWLITREMKFAGFVGTFVNGAHKDIIIEHIGRDILRAPLKKYSDTDVLTFKYEKEESLISDCPSSKYPRSYASKLLDQITG